MTVHRLRAENAHVDDFDFADFYERDRAHCVSAGAEPLTPEATLAWLAEWHPTGPFSAGVGGADAATVRKPEAAPRACTDGRDTGGTLGRRNRQQRANMGRS